MARSIKNYVPKISIPKSRPRMPDWWSAEGDEPEEFEEMTLQQHLEEFRDRIIRTLIAIVPAFIIGWIFHGRILSDIRDKSQAIDGLQVLDAVSPITMSFQISLYIAISISIPVIFYQFIAFLMPGMTRKEKKFLFSSLPFVTILFVTGAWFGYFVAAPRALEFLSGWNSDFLKWEITAQNAVSFFLRLVIGIGLGFQLPVIVFVLSKLGIVSVAKLREWRKYAYLVLLVAAAIITPTPDPMNMAVVAIPLILLYELGIIVSAIFGRTIIRDEEKAEKEAKRADKSIDSGDI